MIGDIVGRPGRNMVIEHLKEIKEQHQIDFVVANVENAAAGFGLLPYMGEEFLAAGVDVMTSGNHIFDKRDVQDYFKDQPRLLRPANYPDDVPGSGLWVGRSKNSITIAVINIQGRVFMAPNDCPFRAADRLIASQSGKARIILVDHHAEASSEKVAMGWYLDGRCSAVVGTHTHIQTADERVLPGGTAYITDLGRGLPRKFETAERGTRLCGAIIDINEQTGQASSIMRLQVPYD
jgi:2',3'-cyclic-nucleotide 2'-phosphodiesterase